MEGGGGKGGKCQVPTGEGTGSPPPHPTGQLNRQGEEAGGGGLKGFLEGNSNA